MMRAIVTGGGTGGHIYPALAVAQALMSADRDAEIVYVGGVTGMEAEIVPAAGLRFEGLTTRKLRKVLSPDSVLVMLALLKGYREAARLLDRHRPDVVVGTGGYVAAAAVLAAQRRRVPTLILAPDAVPGRTNRALSRRADRICVVFDETVTAFPAGKAIVTGLPVRAGIVSPLGKGEARRALGLDPDTFTLFVYGGSQGAMRLNEIGPQAARLIGGPLQVIHQVGARNYHGELSEPWKRSGVLWSPKAYLDAHELPLAYGAADLMVCRTGVSTLAEVAANGLPALMVPLPTAYADHQTANARAVERAGAGILMPQAGLTPEVLAREVSALRSDRDTLAGMAARSQAIGRPDAAARVAALARELVRAAS